MTIRLVEPSGYQISIICICRRPSQFREMSLGEGGGVSPKHKVMVMKELLQWLPAVKLAPLDGSVTFFVEG